MPWLQTTFVKVPYQGVNWIHPLKQRKVEELLKYTRETYPSVTEIIVFGSSIRDDCQVNSDIDIVVFGAHYGFIAPYNDSYSVLYGEDLIPGTFLWKNSIEDGVCVYGNYTTL